MNPVSRALAALAVPLLWAGVALAQEQPQPPGPEATGRWYLHFAAGSFHPDRNAQLGDENGKYGFAFGLGSRQSRHFAWEVELFSDEYSVNTPPGLVGGFLITTSGRADISTIGVAGNLRFIYPMGRFEPYLGGGLGLYRTELTVGQTLLGFPGSEERDDTNLGTQLLAGVEYHFGEGGSSIGLQYRVLNLDASFGPEVPGNVKVGGNFLFLTYRRTFQ